MIDLKDMSPDDKSMYWRNCYVFDFEHKIPYIVTGYDGSFRVTNLLNSQDSGVSNARFARDFCTHRPPLGWRNVGPYALYAYSYPGRSNRKALSHQEVIVEFPFYSSIASVYSKMRNKMFMINEAGQEVSADMKEDMKALCTALESISRTRAARDSRNSYMRNFFSDFLPKDQAIQSVLSGKRASAAINSTWAITITTALYKGAAAIMYDDDEVGVVTEQDVVFPDTQEALEAAWNRL